MWSQKGFGLGTVILVRDTLVIMSDEGVLSLVQANPINLKNYSKPKFYLAKVIGYQ